LWPNWRGPYCNGRSKPAANLPDKPVTGMREVWVSEQRLPGTYRADSRTGGKLSENLLSSGYSSPIVAEGGVYLYYYVPNGDAYYKASIKRHIDAGREHATMGRKLVYISANEVLIRVDAETGKTDWKRTYVAAGHNLEGPFNKGGGQFTPCYGHGNIYTIGTSAKIYCVNAGTGKPVWENDLGIRRRYEADAQEYFERTGEMTGRRNDYAGCPLVVGDVVVVSDHRQYKGGPRNMGAIGLVGFDAHTGEYLWYQRGLGGTGMLASSPVRWVHQGKEYAIGAGAGVGCVDPSTGELLWKIGGGWNNAAAIDGDRLLFATADGVTCHRLSLKGARPRWTAKADYKESSPVIQDRHLFCSSGGGIVCFRMSDGKFVAGGGKGAPVWAALAGGDGYVFAQGKEGSRKGINVLKLLEDKQELKVVAFIPVSPSTCTSPAYTSGRLYMRSLDRLRCFEFTYD
jgi:outer membrane protein assembly factor BamB